MTEYAEVNDIDLLSTMNAAPKDNTPILAKLRDDLGPYDNSGNLEKFNGLWVVVSHEPDSDMGWNLAGPFGFGGFSDSWFDGWIDLPNTGENQR